MKLVHRCVTCHWPVWPWQHFGFLYFHGRLEYWHAIRCEP